MAKEYIRQPLTDEERQRVDDGTFDPKTRVIKEVETIIVPEREEVKERPLTAGGLEREIAEMTEQIEALRARKTEYEALLVKVNTELDKPADPRT